MKVNIWQTKRLCHVLIKQVPGGKTSFCSSSVKCAVAIIRTITFFVFHSQKPRNNCQSSYIFLSLRCPDQGRVSPETERGTFYSLQRETRHVRMHHPRKHRGCGCKGKLCVIHMSEQETCLCWQFSLYLAQTGSMRREAVDKSFVCLKTKLKMIMAPQKCPGRLSMRVSGSFLEMF